MQDTLDVHKINDDFWNTIAAFRSKPGNADAGFGAMVMKQTLNGSYGLVTSSSSSLGGG
jgi:hypothetical protein